MALFERPQPQLGTEGNVVWRRIVAIIIDIVLIGIVTSLISGVLAQGRIPVLGSIVAIVISFGYYIYLEGTYGQTIGKMALDIVVVTEDGDSIEYGPAAIRTLLRLVDVLPFLYLIGFIVMLVTDRRQRIGDVVADTVVVRAQDA